MAPQLLTKPTPMPNRGAAGATVYYNHMNELEAEQLLAQIIEGNPVPTFVIDAVPVVSG